MYTVVSTDKSNPMYCEMNCIREFRDRCGNLCMYVCMCRLHFFFVAAFEEATAAAAAAALPLPLLPGPTTVDIFNLVLIDPWTPAWAFSYERGGDGWVDG
jgi:hypothetical protein